MLLICNILFSKHPINYNLRNPTRDKTNENYINEVTTTNQNRVHLIHNDLLLYGQ